MTEIARHGVEHEPPPDRRRPGALRRAAILLGGVILSQAVLYGPSLAGRKILLPLDLLATSGWYLPKTPPWDNVQPRNRVFSDEILAFEFRRRFAAREVRAGRLPLWNPYNDCGSPFLAANNTGVFSPFTLPSYLFPGPETIAWVQVLKSLVAAVGAFLFFRRAMGVGFWPAIAGAWGFPLVGFLVLFRGYPPSFVVVWLPWLLLAVDAAVRRPDGKRGAAVAAVTALVLVSGHLAVAGLVLLGSGLYFVWRLIELHGWRSLTGRPAFRATLTTTAGWLLGMLLSAPQTIPTAEYLSYSNRVAERIKQGPFGNEMLQPGIGVLPQFVLPYFYGSSERGSRWIAPGRGSNRLEGAASGYAGLLAALVLAPIGLTRRRRREWLFWLAAGTFAASYTLHVPLVEQVFRLPPLGLLNNNRLVFLTAWSILVLGVLGLETLGRGDFVWRSWYAASIGVLLGLALWCAYRAFVLPDVITRISDSAGDVEAVQSWFRRMYVESAALSAVGLSLWWLLWRGRLMRHAARVALVLLVVGESLWMAYGVSSQCDPALYYPRLEALETLRGKPGRICGMHCFPACLNQSHDLYDIRGYDGVDPIHLVELIKICRRQFPRESWINLPYARLQYILPVNSPIIDMLNVRFRILRGQLKGSEAFIQKDGYIVLKNKKALPRAFVPRRVERLDDETEVLARLERRDFRPREVAYVTGELSPTVTEPAQGEARITDYHPNEVRLAADMQRPGLVVLADLWFPGWKAYVDERPVPLLRTNHALRGVEVPTGRHDLRFRYEPMSFSIGLAVGGLALIVILAWLGFGFRKPAVVEVVKSDPQADRGSTSSGTKRSSFRRRGGSRRH